MASFPFNPRSLFGNFLMQVHQSVGHWLLCSMRGQSTACHCTLYSACPSQQKKERASSKKRKNELHVKECEELYFSCNYVIITGHP